MQDRSTIFDWEEQVKFLHVQMKHGVPYSETSLIQASISGPHCLNQHTMLSSMSWTEPVYSSHLSNPAKFCGPKVAGLERFHCIARSTVLMA